MGYSTYNNTNIQILNNTKKREYILNIFFYFNFLQSPQYFTPFHTVLLPFNVPLNKTLNFPQNFLCFAFCFISFYIFCCVFFLYFLLYILQNSTEQPKASFCCRILKHIEFFLFLSFYYILIYIICLYHWNEDLVLYSKYCWGLSKSIFQSPNQQITTKRQKCQVERWWWIKENI